MRTFTHSAAGARWFWNIDLQGRRLVLYFGEHGREGETEAVDFGGPEEARREHDRLIAERLAQGYVETTPPAAPPADALRDALEAALVADPDDMAAHMAYADHLQELGDPRGELIQVQLALEDRQIKGRRRRQLRGRERELLRAHHHEWLGELDSHFPIRIRGSQNDLLFRFARGWLDCLSINYLTTAFANALALAPEVRLLRDFTVVRAENHTTILYPDEERAQIEYVVGLGPLGGSPFLLNVRAFRYGEDHGDDDYHFRYAERTSAVVDVVRQMPRLEELHLWADGFDVNRLVELHTLTRLRVLRLTHLGQRRCLEALAGNPALGRLTHLLLHPYPLARGAEPTLELDGARALFSSRHLRSLTYLRLRKCTMGDAGCEAIARSGILGRLAVLDLRHGCITDEGAAVLAACPELRRLEYLDVGDNRLTAAGLDRLHATGIDVRADGPGVPEAAREDGGEHGYVYGGEFE